MSDKRAFAKFDAGYFDNPKIGSIYDTSRTAVCMHLESVMYSARHLTDGFVSPSSLQRRLGGTEADTRLLIDRGLWHEPGHGCKYCPQPPEEMVYVHDYTEHNRTSDEVKHRSEAARRNVDARYAKAAPVLSVVPVVEEMPTSRTTSRSSKQDTLPIPNGLLKREREREVKRLVQASSNEFDEWWERYPKKQAKDAARKAFTAARKKASLEELMDGLGRFEFGEPQFIPLPASWLNAGRWADEPTQRSSSVPGYLEWANPNA